MGETRISSIEIQIEQKITIMLCTMKPKGNASEETPDVTYNMGQQYLRTQSTSPVLLFSFAFRLGAT